MNVYESWTDLSACLPHYPTQTCSHIWFVRICSPWFRDQKTSGARGVFHAFDYTGTFPFLCMHVFEPACICVCVCVHTHVFNWLQWSSVQLSMTVLLQCFSLFMSDFLVDQRFKQGIALWKILFGAVKEGLKSCHALFQNIYTGKISWFSAAYSRKACVPGADPSV